MVSNNQGNSTVKVNQDVNVLALELEVNNEIEYLVEEGRQAYLVQIKEQSNINGITLNERDAMEIIEENIKIKAEVLSHFIIVEMKKSEE
jgi:redox-sensitive bicupin YhaK (pirin superfamily)